jgi:heptosyltransferase-3
VLYIGPDTGITHLAAATNVPVIALYGPTNPVKWTPWPYGFEQSVNPFEKIGSQTVNNVFLLQGEKPCVPCHLEGCDRHQKSRSACLDELSSERVKETIHLILNK